MRGEDQRSGSLLSYVDLEARVAADHPLRTIRTIVDDALSGLLMEQLDYRLLYRWFVGLRIDHPVWHPTAFTTNRDRLRAGDLAAKLLAAVPQPSAGPGTPEP